MPSADPATERLDSSGVTAAGSVVMAVAGSAPAYSIAASTAVLVGAAGLGSPGALLWCAIPMLGIAFAFSFLGRLDVNSGASYSWVARALHPGLGFMAGWALVIASTIVMVAVVLPVGQLTLALFNPSLESNTTLVTIIGTAWFLASAAFVWFGIHVSARAQWILSSAEVIILIVFALIAGVRALRGEHPGAAFSWSWFGFSHIGGTGAFVSAALVAAFYFWGWDVSSNLNEETKDGHRNAGLGGLIGVAIVFLLFEAFTVATLILLPIDSIQKSSGNVLAALGDAIWPGPGGKILIVAVMLSTIATLETTLIQLTRSLFAMGRDRTVPDKFGELSPKWRTPVFATAVIVGVSLIIFVGSNYVGSVGTILSDAISSIGLQIAFYYALAGVAVIVAYRRALFTSVRNFLLIGLWPAVGAVFMAVMFFAAIPNNDAVVNWIGLGALALGLIPLVAYYRRAKAYYTRRPLQIPPEFTERRRAVPAVETP